MIADETLLCNVPFLRVNLDNKNKKTILRATCLITWSVAGSDDSRTTSKPYWMNYGDDGGSMSELCNWCEYHFPSSKALSKTR